MTQPTFWKPTPEERRAIRDYAARRAGLRPGGMVLEVNTRTTLDGATLSDNVLALGGFERSDLHDRNRWTDWRGCALVDGCAVVDLAVNKRDFCGDLELETHVQAVVGTLRGKPRLAWCEEQGRAVFDMIGARHDWDRLPVLGAHWK